MEGCRCFLIALGPQRHKRRHLVLRAVHRGSGDSGPQAPHHGLIDSNLSGVALAERSVGPGLELAHQSTVVPANQVGSVCECLGLPEAQGDTLSQGCVGVEAGVTQQEVSLDNRVVAVHERASPVRDPAHQLHFGDRCTRLQPWRDGGKAGHNALKPDPITQRPSIRVDLRQPAGQAEGAVVFAHGEEDPVRGQIDVGKRGAREVCSGPEPIVPGEMSRGRTIGND